MKIESQWRKCPHMTGGQETLWGILFINDECGRVQFTEGKATPENIVLCGLRKQDEQANKQYESIASLQFLSQVPVLNFFPDFPS